METDRKKDTLTNEKTNYLHCVQTLERHRDKQKQKTRMDKDKKCCI